MSDVLAQFGRAQYLNLETYRKSGQAMPTPVWFAADDGVLYVRTVANSGKIKRIRHNPHVRVVPCGVQGQPRGEWVEGQASFADEPTAQRINQLLSRKYGLQKWLFELIGQRREYTVIAIRV